MIQVDTASDPIPAPPADAQSFAGYINGAFQTYQPLRRRFPAALVLPISVFVPAPAELQGLRQVAFDVENGDITPAQINACLDVAHHMGIPCPVVYGSLDTWERPGGLNEQLAGRRNGIDHQRWLAHPDAIAAVPAGFAAKQYLFGPEWDSSVVLDPVSFYNLAKPAPTPEEIMAIAAAVNDDGRLEVFVEASDGSIWHTWQDKAGGGWQGAEPGKRSSQLVQLAAAPGK